jgi:hypothetical protein
VSHVVVIVAIKTRNREMLKLQGLWWHCPYKNTPPPHIPGGVFAAQGKSNCKSYLASGWAYPTTNKADTKIFVVLNPILADKYAVAGGASPTPCNAAVD